MESKIIYRENHYFTASESFVHLSRDRNNERIDLTLLQIQTSSVLLCITCLLNVSIIYFYCI